MYGLPIINLTEHARAINLAAQYSKGKPIRLLTIADLGGETRHAIRTGKHFLRDPKARFAEKTRREELRGRVIEHLEAHGPTRSSVLSAELGTTHLHVAMALRGLVRIQSGIQSGDREKTYWLRR